MPVIVQKYGGSSVADVDKIRAVADKVAATARRGNQVVVVVSAMGKTTDSLLALAQQAGTVDGVATTPPRRELDMLVTTGERVSMALLSIAIHARGLDAISFTGSQCGIMTNDRHFNARIIEVRPHRVEDELERGRIVIVAGYQGMSYTREITTLGRGGSDTTAVALAAALRADSCEIYSDVDGVYSADPRAVPDAKHLAQIDPSMLQEMAECGAKVLNAQAVEWAKRAGIAIYARASFGPASQDGVPERQTVVQRLNLEPDTRVRAVVCEPNAALVTVGASASFAPAQVASSLGGLDLPVRDLVVSQNSVSFVVPLSNVPDWDTGRASLAQLEKLGTLRVLPKAAVVSVVGSGLADNLGPLAGFGTCLTASNIAVHQLGASALRLHAVIDADQAIAAQQALHARFVS